MRKRIIPQDTPGTSSPREEWLNLEHLAEVELTSEDPSHPIEFAFTPETGRGWRASEPGPQTIRIRFDKPLHVKHIHLAFQEDEQPRTQEFLLRWSSDGGGSYREITRQQYNFSPPHTNREEEDYAVDLQDLNVLEITITPDINGGNARASMRQFLVA